MRSRWDWLKPVLQPPYVPTLGIVAPDVLSAELFDAVADIAGTGRFLPYDKDQRWSATKDEHVLVDQIVHRPNHTQIPTLISRGSGVVKLHHYVCKPPDPCRRPGPSRQDRRWSRCRRSPGAVVQLPQSRGRPQPVHAEDLPPRGLGRRRHFPDHGPDRLLRRRHLRRVHGRDRPRRVQLPAPADARRTRRRPDPGHHRSRQDRRSDRAVVDPHRQRRSTVPAAPVLRRPPRPPRPRPRPGGRVRATSRKVAMRSRGRPEYDRKESSGHVVAGQSGHATARLRLGDRGRACLRYGRRPIIRSPVSSIGDQLGHPQGRVAGRPIPMPLFHGYLIAI